MKLMLSIAHSSFLLSYFNQDSLLQTFSEAHGPGNSKLYQADNTAITPPTYLLSISITCTRQIKISSIMCPTLSQDWRSSRCQANKTYELTF